MAERLVLLGLPCPCLSSDCEQKTRTSRFSKEPGNPLVRGTLTRDRVFQHAPKMWGTSIVGFGSRHYKYASGSEGDWFVIGFSPRKQDLTLYLAGGLSPNSALMQQLGKHKTGGSCLYIKRLSDVDLGVLEELLRQAIKEMGKYKVQAHPTQSAKK